MAGAVVLVALVAQGVSLPRLVRRLGLKPHDLRSEEKRIRLRAGRVALAWLDNHRDGRRQRRRHQIGPAFYEARTRRLGATGSNEQKLAVGEEMETTSRYGRSEVLDQRCDGRVSATLLRTSERDLDLEESGLGDA
ncbi:MAG: hypothetical protein WA622_09955 [Mycobacterium sp.]|uniref:hypothetical protein n=1 Tax=Mycobacterium sp. TaxID=1785 RepID=UPI003BB4F0AB